MPNIARGYHELNQYLYNLDSGDGQRDGKISKNIPTEIQKMEPAKVEIGLSTIVQHWLGIEGSTFKPEKLEIILDQAKKQNWTADHLNLLTMHLLEIADKTNSDYLDTFGKQLNQWSQKNTQQDILDFVIYCSQQPVQAPAMFEAATHFQEKMQLSLNKIQTDIFDYLGSNNCSNAAMSALMKDNASSINKNLLDRIKTTIDTLGYSAPMILKHLPVLNTLNTSEFQDFLNLCVGNYKSLMSTEFSNQLVAILSFPGTELNPQITPKQVMAILKEFETVEPFIMVKLLATTRKQNKASLQSILEIAHHWENKELDLKDLSDIMDCGFNTPEILNRLFYNVPMINIEIWMISAIYKNFKKPSPDKIIELLKSLKELGDNNQDIEDISKLDMPENAIQEVAWLKQQLPRHSAFDNIFNLFKSLHQLAPQKEEKLAMLQKFTASKSSYELSFYLFLRNDKKVSDQDAFEITQKCAELLAKYKYASYNLESFQELLVALPPEQMKCSNINEKLEMITKYTLSVLEIYGRLHKNMNLDFNNCSLQNIATELANKTNSFSKEYLSKDKLGMPVDSTYNQLAIVINKLHDNQNELNNSDSIRLQFAQQLDATSLYFLIAQGGGDLYTSTFNKLFDQIKNKTSDIYSWIAEIDPTHRYTTRFMLCLANYDQLDLFYKDKEKFIAFAKQILSSSENLVTNAAQLITPLTHIIKTGSADIQEKIADFLVTTYQLKSKVWEKRAFAYLIKSVANHYSASMLPNSQKLVQIARSLPESLKPVIPSADWLKSGILTAKMYFYPDETWFRTTVADFKKIQGVRVVSENDNIVVIEKQVKHVSGKPIILRYILTREPLEKANRLEDLRSNEFQILAHRGHSFHLNNTFPAESLTIHPPKLLIGGSCGSFGAMTTDDFLMNYSGNYFSANQGTGYGAVNNRIITSLMAAIGKGETDWSKAFPNDIEKNGVYLPTNPAFLIGEYIQRLTTDISAEQADPFEQLKVDKSLDGLWQFPDAEAKLKRLWTKGYIEANDIFTYLHWMIQQGQTKLLNDVFSKWQLHKTSSIQQKIMGGPDLIMQVYHQLDEKNKATLEKVLIIDSLNREFKQLRLQDTDKQDLLDNANQDYWNKILKLDIASIRAQLQAYLLDNTKAILNINYQQLNADDSKLISLVFC